MNQLYPIIRRKRRPLIIEDELPVTTAQEPVQSVALGPLVAPTVASSDKPTAKHKKSRDDAAHN